MTTTTQTTRKTVPNQTPGGLTRAEFLRGQKQGKYKGMTWEGVYAWQTRKRAEREAERTAKQATAYGAQNYQIPMDQILASAVTRFPMNPSYGAWTPQQIQRQANSLVSPFANKQIDQLTNELNIRASRGAGAINNFMNQYRASFPEMQADVKSIYDSAVNAQSAASAGFADFVRNSGAKMAGDLAAAEASAGQTSEGSDFLKNVAGGEASATAANDWSSMTRLLSEGAAANAYTAQLPAIANAWAANTARDFQFNINDMLRTGTQDIRDQAASQMSDTMKWLYDRELQKAQGRDAINQNRSNWIATWMGQNNDNAIAGQALRNQMAQQAAANGQAYTDTYGTSVTTQDSSGAAGNGPWDTYRSEYDNLQQNFLGQHYNKAGIYSGPDATTPAGYRVLYNQTLNMIRAKTGATNPKVLAAMTQNFLVSMGIPMPPKPVKKPPKSTTAAATGGWPNGAPPGVQGPGGLNPTPIAPPPVGPGGRR